MTMSLTSSERVAEDPRKVAARVRAARSRDRKRIRLAIARQTAEDGVVDAAIVAALLDATGLSDVDLEARRRVITAVLQNAGRTLALAGVVGYRDRIVGRTTALRISQISMQGA